MQIITFIEDEEVIEMILKHLGLWEMKAIKREGLLSAMTLLFRAPQESEDFISISPRGYMISTGNPHPKMSSFSNDL
jgi:hypothetical protein